MKINGIEVQGESFAYDGCHKIYVIENKADEQEAFDFGYDIYPVAQLVDTYKNSCGLKFISNWALTKRYADQGEKAKFEVGVK